MKKSKQVPASLVVAAAGLAAAGCGSSGGYDCVDGVGRVLDGPECARTSGAHYIRRTSYGGFGGSGTSGGGFFGG